jgi:hypothetical protein
MPTVPHLDSPELASAQTLADVTTKAFDSIADWVRDNWTGIKCCDLLKAYEVLLKQVGSRRNFTGFAEFLTAMVLEEMLRTPGRYGQAELCVRRETNLSLARPPVRETDGTPQKTALPDFTLWKKADGRPDDLVGIVEVTTGKSLSDLKQEFAKLGAIRASYSRLRAVTVFFRKPASGTKYLKEIREKQRERGWYGYIVLESEAQVFHEVLAQGLGLRA